MNEQNEKLHNEIQAIRQQMKTILILGNIQELLVTNIIRLSELTNGTNDKVKTKAEIREQINKLYKTINKTHDISPF